jgi:hypothetical protein
MRADDRTLADGFHAFAADTGVRWTNANAAVPAAAYGWFRPMEVVLTVGGTTRYADDGVCRRVA